MICRVCLQNLNDDRFGKNPSGKLKSICRKCQSDQWRNKNQEKVREIARNGYHRKVQTKEQREESNRKVREYRQRRKEEGNPIKRKNDYHSKSKFFRWTREKLQIVVFELKGMICSYCGGLATGIDHVVPVSRGGLHDLSNLVPCCRSCNSSKGNKTLEEWHNMKKNIYLITKQER